MSDTTAPPEGQQPAAPATQLDRRLNRTVMALLTVALSVWLLDYFSVLLQQLLVAAFFACMVIPAHSRLVNRGVPTWLAYILLVAVIVLLLGSMAVTVRFSLGDLSVKLPEYRRNIKLVTEDLTENLPGLNADAIMAGLIGESTDPEGRSAGATSADDPEKAREAAEVARLAGFINRAIDFSGQAIVVLVYLLFILAEKSSFPGRIRAAFSDEGTVLVNEKLREVNKAVGEYIYVKTFISVLTGFFSGAVIYAFNVPYAVLFGVVTFLFNYIPYIGAFVAMVVPVLLSLAIKMDPLYSLGLFAALTAVQNILGYGVEPQMTGRRVNLSPLVIIIALAFWGFLWGIVGMILAVPLMVITKIILEQYNDWRFLAVLLSNDSEREAEAGASTAGRADSARDESP